MTEKRFFKWYKDDVSVTLRNRSGSYGGGSEVFVIEEDDELPESDRNIISGRTSGELQRTGRVQRYADC